MMRFSAFVFLVCMSVFGLSSQQAQSGPLSHDAALSGYAFHHEGFGHGGGCREDSPEGQCCHMDREKEEDHCH